MTQKPRHETISEVDDGESQDLAEDEHITESDEESIIKVDPSAVTPVNRSPSPPELIQVTFRLLSSVNCRC